MARETITRLVDDLDGGVAHETVAFGLDGRLYEIDLSSKNAKKLRGELATYIERGNRVSPGTASAGPARSPRRGGPVVADKDQNRAVREWAQAKGFDVASRGRVKQDIIDEYRKTAGR